MRGPSSEPETPSGPGSLKVSDEEPAPVGISQMPSIGLPAASDQEPHSIPSSALHGSQSLVPELLSTTTKSTNELDVEESGDTCFEKVRTVRINVQTMECRRSLEAFGRPRSNFESFVLTSLRMPFVLKRFPSVSTVPVSLLEPI